MAKVTFNSKTEPFRRIVSVYFGANIDENTKKWLEDNNSNLSRAIVDLVAMYANGELISKEQVEKEKKILKDRADEIKSILDMVLSSNHNNTRIQANSMQYKDVDTNSINDTQEVEDIKINVDKEKESNIVESIIKKTETTNQEIPISTQVYDTPPQTSVDNQHTVTNIEDHKPNRSISGIGIGIGKYKDGRGYRKKGKGLADL